MALSLPAIAVHGLASGAWCVAAAFAVALLVQLPRASIRLGITHPSSLARWTVTTRALPVHGPASVYRGSKKYPWPRCDPEA